MERKYQRLRVWQEAMTLVELSYQALKELPEYERFGLTDQMRRASISIPSNIAEGAGQGSDKAFLRFLYIARGSLQELETQILLCSKLSLMKNTELLLEQSNRVFALITALINKLKA